MKKITILAFLCALFVGASANAQEVTYKEDASQGYLQNQFKDNWFISLEAGGNLWLTPNDKEEPLLKRIQPQVEINVGKWFSPIIGLRVGVSGARVKGATYPGYANKDFVQESAACDNNSASHQVQFQLGLAGDVMLNLTNWWCGYKADRVYNGIFYAGTTITGCGSTDGNVGFDIQDKEWLGVRAGLLNTFAVSKKVDLLVDLRFGVNQTGLEGKLFTYKTDLLIGAAYKFGKSTWSAPIVPVCPTFKYTDAEGDALVARLQQADAKIASLEQQLRDCLNSKQTAAVVEEAPAAPLATIYFPIGSANVNNVQAKVVKAVANAMQNTNDKYVLTGWADNYTGSAEINKKLRAKRAASVKKMIVKTGVAADRLETTTNDNNLTEYGEKSASLDRAVTINVAE